MGGDVDQSCDNSAVDCTVVRVTPEFRPEVKSDDDLVAIDRAHLRLEPLMKWHLHHRFSEVADYLFTHECSFAFLQRQ